MAAVGCGGLGCADHRRITGGSRVADTALRLAAFGHPPDSAVAEAAAFAAAANPGGSDRQRWLAAVALGGQGRYAAAAVLLRRMIAGPDPVFAALAASTLASHRRQLGGHAAAGALDSVALGRMAASIDVVTPSDPDGVDAHGALHDSLLGLAADAIGLGRPDRARSLIAVAAQRCAVGWRGRVRLGWVMAEAHLASGEPDLAVPLAERAEQEARRVGALRHVVKSSLVWAVSLTAQGTESGQLRAVELLEDSLAISLERGFLPLAWPIASLLVDASPAFSAQYRDLARTAVSCVFSRSDGEGRRIAAASPWMAGALRRTGEATAAEV